MNLQQIVTISPDVLAQEVNDEIVLLDLNSEQYLGLNEVGARVWQLLEEGDNLKQIYKKLLEEYDVEQDLLKNDLTDLIKNMCDAGIVTTSQ